MKTLRTKDLSTNALIEYKQITRYHALYVRCAQGYTGIIDWGVTYITYLTLLYITSYVFIKLVAPTVNLKR